MFNEEKQKIQHLPQVLENSQTDENLKTPNWAGSVM